VEYVWYVNETGFSLWKRYEEDGKQKERPVYHQNQQATWFTEEIKSDRDSEELSDDFLECLTQLRNEIHAYTEARRSESQTIAEYRKQLHQELDFKEKKIVSEILVYFGKSEMQPIDEMAELMDYAGRNSNLDFTDLEPKDGENQS